MKINKVIRDWLLELHEKRRIHIEGSILKLLEAEDTDTEFTTYIKEATVAIEDQDFYTHKGIKPTAFLRAVLVNLTSFSYSQGGSTITQQVIKKTVLSDDKTPTRKIKEWILALRLEKMLTKDEIFELYLNEIPYGGNNYGVEEASQTYFGKKASDVTIAEAAYLAALPQAPSYYSPYGSHKDKLDIRKNVVLKENANRYTCEGKLSNFNFLKKPDRKVIDKKYAMSFAEFKKLNLKRL